MSAEGGKLFPLFIGGFERFKAGRLSSIGDEDRVIIRALEGGAPFIEPLDPSKFENKKLGYNG